VPEPPEVKRAFAPPRPVSEEQAERALSRAEAEAEVPMREAYAELLARAPESDIEPTLERTARALALLGDPQESLTVIHVAGTNGKTSTARMIASLLVAAGIRTGLYTSPHLTTVRERIELDGEEISRAAFVAAWREVAPAIAAADAESQAAGGPPLTFFEALTVLAFAAFADAPCDVAVVEVGLGGTWDATNVVTPSVCVITPISRDHTAWLGDSLDSIAREKAGILKPGVPAVIGRQKMEPEQVLQATCQERGVPAIWLGRDLDVLSRTMAVGGQVLTLRGAGGTYEEVFLPLHGAHQADNAACALAAVEVLFSHSLRAESGEALISNPPSAEHVETGQLRTLSEPLVVGFSHTQREGAGVEREGAGVEREGGRVGVGALGARVVEEGLGSVRSPGRIEVVRSSPLVVVDAAHNLGGAQALREAMDEAFGRDLVGLVGLLDDKDAEGFFGALEPILEQVVVTASSSSRAVDPAELGKVAVDVFGDPDRVEVVGRLDEALARAIELAEQLTGDAPGALAAGVLATGSITLVGEVRVLLTPRSTRRSGVGGPRPLRRDYPLG